MSAIYAEFNAADRFCGLLVAVNDCGEDDVWVMWTDVNGLSLSGQIVSDPTNVLFAAAFCGEEHLVDPKGDEQATLVRIDDHLNVSSQVITQLAYKLRSQYLTPDDLICSCGGAAVCRCGDGSPICIDCYNEQLGGSD